LLYQLKAGPQAALFCDGLFAKNAQWDGPAPCRNLRDAFIAHNPSGIGKLTMQQPDRHASSIL